MVLLNSGFKQNNDMQGFRQVTQSQIQMYNLTSDYFFIPT